MAPAPPAIAEKESRTPLECAHAGPASPPVASSDLMQLSNRGI